MTGHAIIIATLLREEGETGVQSHIRVFREYLTGRGRAVRVITPFANPRLLVYPVFAVRRVIDPLCGPLSVWWYRYWHYRFLRTALRRELADNRQKTVYAQCPLSAKAALEARTGHNQPVVMAVHFNVSQASEWAGKGKIREKGFLFEAILKLERRVLPLLDGIVFVSWYMRECLRERIPEVKKVSSVVIPNFIAPPQPVAGSSPRGDLVSIGTIEPRKNQHYLLRLLAETNRLGLRLTLTLIGDGPNRQRLETAAVELGVGQQVTFAGFQPEAGRMLSSFRMYVHAATMENLPISIIEALAAGLPVAAIPAGGIPELFDDGCEGVYLPQHDPAGGARLIATLLSDPERMKSMATAAGERFSQKFSEEKTAGVLHSFLLSTHQAERERS